MPSSAQLFDQIDAWRKKTELELCRLYPPDVETLVVVETSDGVINGSYIGPRDGKALGWHLVKRIMCRALSPSCRQTIAALPHKIKSFAGVGAAPVCWPVQVLPPIDENSWFHPREIARRERAANGGGMDPEHVCEKTFEIL